MRQVQTIINIFSWYFIPPILVSTLLRGLYMIIPHPGHGTRTHRQHYIAAHILVISSYILYTLYQAYASLSSPPNFYALLDVPTSVDESTLRKAFKRSTLKFHPDKVGPGGETHFIALKTAYDTLSAPATRYAYDRFGEDVLRWNTAGSTVEYVHAGLSQLVQLYGASAVGLLGLGWVSGMGGSKFWRFVCFSAVAAFEFALVMREDGVLPEWMVPAGMLPFEQATMAKEIMLSVFIAANHILPMFRREQFAPMSDLELRERTKELVEIAKSADNAAGGVLVGELLPFGQEEGDAAKLEDAVVKEKIEAYVQREVEKRMREKIYRESDAEKA